VKLRGSVPLVQVAFLDYVRFLIGSMWGACTPETFEAKAADLNQGMHKRSVQLHMAMVRKAAMLAADLRCDAA
jgi:hypothetical protein